MTKYEKSLSKYVEAYNKAAKMLGDNIVIITEPEGANYPHLAMWHVEPLISRYRAELGKINAMRQRLTDATICMKRHKITTLEELVSSLLTGKITSGEMKLMRGMFE